MALSYVRAGEGREARVEAGPLKGLLLVKLSGEVLEDCLAWTGRELKRAVQVSDESREAVLLRQEDLLRQEKMRRWAELTA